MIGSIALAVIIVRNSILLVDFSAQQVRDGKSVQGAVIRACKARTRPTVITALALVGGSSVILTGPIFQAMVVSLLFGVLVSTVLTLVVFPLGRASTGKSLRQVAGVTVEAQPVAAPRRRQGFQRCRVLLRSCQGDDGTGMGPQSPDSWNAAQYSGCAHSG